MACFAKMRDEEVMGVMSHIPRGSLMTLLEWENCEMSKSHVQCVFFAFNYSVTLFGIMCLISPCSTEFSAFYEHFYRFLKFLTLAFQQVFPNYLGFAYVWHHDSSMTIII
jgi:hypothetical protein